MRLSARTFAAMLIGLALAAFLPDMDAQSRGGSRSSSTSRSTVSSRPSGQSARPSTGSSSKPSSKPSAKPSTGSSSSRPKPDISPADRNPSRPSGVKPSRPGSGGLKPDHRPDSPKPDHKPGSPKPDYRPGGPNRPVGVRPPAHRPPAARPPKPHRPPVYRPRPYRPVVRIRPVIVRPSYGTMIAADIAASMAWTAVNIAYFNTVAHTYDQISDNAQTIAQQNAVIAQNNSVIAAQNQAIVQSQTRAQEAYGLANGLGLVQSYADAGTSYFYQDGVFYVQGADGQYCVIVPPAGALVESLPEDYQTVILDGNEYYKVDNTIYRMVINEGKPYFEVVGQMN